MASEITIKIDLREVERIFEAALSIAPAIAEESVSELTHKFAEAWKAEAENELDSSLKAYIEGIVAGDDGTVTLHGELPNKMESGSPAYDMKEMLLNGPNAEVGKNGRYNTVRFEHGTPSASKSKFANVMSKEIYGKAKRLNPGQKLKIEGTGKSKLFRDPKSGVIMHYKHKSVVEHDMTREKIQGSRRYSYSTFRRVSEGASDPNSWWHPGFEALNLAEKAFDKFDIKKILNGVVENMLDKLK